MGQGKSKIQALLAAGLSLLEEKAFNLQGAHQSRNESIWLAGNFAPVEGDLFAPNLPVEGALPKEVAGLYARNGPNPVFIQGDVHWFDGDGYIHAMLLDPEAQTATYSGNFVQTHRLKQEMAAGRGLFTRLGDWRGRASLLLLLVDELRGKLGIMNRETGIGTANTNLLWHGGMLHALHEADQPYILKVTPEGKIETVGRVHKAGPTPQSWFTAHPKVDPVSKKLYAFGYNMIKKPFMAYYLVDADGTAVRHIDLNFSLPIMMHDFVASEHYAIFLETSLYFDAERVARQGGSHTNIFHFDHNKPTRVLVLPLEATSIEEGIWLDDLPPSFLFHYANAWEEADGSIIRVILVRYDEFQFTFEGTFVKDDGSFSEEIKRRRSPDLYLYTLDLRTKAVTCRKLVEESRGFEFPQIDPRLAGRKSRFVYLNIWTDKGEAESFVKVDTAPALEADDDGDIMVPMTEVPFGEDTYGGELTFVPRENGESEDDGYLVTFTYSRVNNTSEFRVYDAKTMAQEPVARVKLPRRVPYGFHGLFVPKSELDKQTCPTSLA